MPFIRITVEGLDQVIGRLSGVSDPMANTKRNVLSEVSDFMVSELKRNVHLWKPGEPRKKPHMRDTIRSQYVTESQVLVEVPTTYAQAENARGGFKVGAGPHNFADRAEQATRNRFSQIIASAYGNMFSSL